MVGGVGSVSRSYSTSALSGAGKTAEINANQNESPVTPVARTAAVEKERLNPVEYQLPQSNEQLDAKEMSVRNRLATSTEQVQLKGQLAEAMSDLEEADLEALQQTEEEKVENEAQAECECCKNRKYKDGSTDGSVSYQTPTHISPETSGVKVMAHEQEHVTNEQVYAAREGKEVRSQSVSLEQSVCPECGVSYTSGGKTTTVTAEVTNSEAPENKISLSSASVDKLMGFNAS